jgi:nitrite reductase (NO-forming)
MNSKRISIIALLLAIFAVLVTVIMLDRVNTIKNSLAQGITTTQASPAQTESAAGQSQSVAQDVQTALDRIGAVTLEPAHPTDVPNVARDPADVPPPITRTEPTTVKFTLTVKEVTAELADGVTYEFWTFDGTVPGPLLRVMVGDTIELTLVNPPADKNGHNIDLHAVNGPGGGAAVTNVGPGETKTVTFKALNTGVFVYHCAFPPPMHHIAQGMYGAILVEPVGGLPKVDREFYVMQGEWYTSGKLGDQGHQVFSEAKALAEQPEYFTFNGNTAALTELYPLEAKVGEKIRIFFGDGGPNVGANFHVIGEIFDKVYSGSPDTYTANEETWYVPPGSVSTFELILDEPGSYTLVDHALYRVLKGAVGTLHVTGDWNPDIYMPEASGASH